MSVINTFLAGDAGKADYDGLAALAQSMEERGDALEQLLREAHEVEQREEDVVAKVKKDLCDYLDERIVALKSIQENIRG